MRNKRVFVIAEIGLNANGDVSIAKDLILKSKESGCDAVKFQKRTIEAVYSKEELDYFRESPWGNTNRKQKNGLEFSREQYDEIDQYCKQINFLWFASAWDTESQVFLRKYDLLYNKIASALLTHKKLLNMVAEEKKYTFISTGMSDLTQIREAVEVFRSKDCEFELLHCNSTYPMKNEDANLRVIKTLRNEFGCDVGYSGHETGRVVSVAAVALGATSIERHITLDKTMYGSDQAASIEISELKRLVEDIRQVELALGSSEKRVLETEIPIMKKLRKN